MPVTFAVDILPKFRTRDFMCMNGRGISLGKADWMCNPNSTFGFADHGNARHVFERLSDGSMPTDQTWPTDWLTAYQQWIDEGFLQ